MSDTTTTHHPDCRWERATCEYRETHHYCPHPEHSCNCRELRTDTPARPDAGTTLEWRLRDNTCEGYFYAGHCEPGCEQSCGLQYEAADEIARLTAEQERLEAENAALRLTIYELMEDLEAEIRERYNVTDGSDPHPALQRKFDRDIEPVYRARQQLRAPASARKEHAPAQERFACGCITCICEDEVQCHGCGAKRCRKPAAECDWLNECSTGEGEPSDG
jgi:hypothetical protein